VESNGFQADWPGRLTDSGLLPLRNARDFDAVLIDLRMPGMDGLEILRAVPQTGSQAIPIVMTGHGDVTSAVEAMKLGAFDFLSKPPELPLFFQAVNRAVEHGKVLRRGRGMERLVGEWETTFDACPDLIAVLDPAGKIIRCNQALAERLGLEKNQTTGRSYFELLGSGKESAEFRAFSHTLAEKSLGTAEVHHPLLGGDFLVTTTPLREGNDELWGVVTIARNITQLKRAEQIIRESEERFRQLAENIEDVFWLVDASATRMIYVSPAYERIWGRSCQSLYHEPRSWLEAIHPEDRPRAEAIFNSHLKGERFQNEYRIIRPDGAVRWILDSGFPVRDSQGKVYRFAGIARDITLRKQALESLRQSNQRLKALRELDRAILEVQSPGRSDAPLAFARAAVAHLRRLIPCERVAVITLDFEKSQARVVTEDQDGHIDPLDKPSQDGASLVALADLADHLEELREKPVCRLREWGPLTGNVERAASGVERASRLTGLLARIQADQEILGAVGLWANSADSFGPEHEEVLQEAADHLAVALQNARLFDQVLAGRERLQALSTRLVEVQESERRQIARELHDEVGQSLTGLKLLLETARQSPDYGIDQRLRQGLQIVQELQERVRTMSLDLRPTILDDLGLLPALLWFFNRYTSQTSVQVKFEHALDDAGESIPKTFGGGGPRLDPEVETAAYRIIQESLTNVAKHAAVSQATVRIWIQGEMLGVQVSDQGVGFDPLAKRDSRETSGLAGMQERAHLVGGKLFQESAPGRGARVTAELPLTGAQRNGAARS
jgi:PAS domain S-box-containing protein